VGLTKTAAVVDVLLGNEDGGDIVPGDTGDPEDGIREKLSEFRVAYLVPLEIHRRAGGQRLDEASFLYDLSQTGERIANMDTPTDWNRQVEVRLWDPVAEEYTPIFWGDLTSQRLVVDGDSEQVFVSAAVFSYHFGTTLRGPFVKNPSTSAPEGEEYQFDLTLPEDITFNPNIDGIIESNMSPDSAGSHRYWLDPESVRTTEAIAYQGSGPPAMWSMEEAVKALCWRCNEDEEFIKNPIDFDALTDAPEPQNVRMPPGKHLPFYLDHLLHPYGFDWFVHLEDIDGETERRIKIFRRGEGTPKSLYMQPVGETLELDPADPSYTNCVAFDLTTDVGNVANKVRVYGGRKQYEITFELYRGWPESDDGLSEADLDRSDPASQYNTNGKTKVWRLWVANEAGDWNETRTGVAPIPDAPRDWSDFGVLVPRRRKIEDCLTKDDEGRRLPEQLEYSDGEHEDPEDEESELVWKPVPKAWTWSVHESQMAIEFVGDQPPAELIAAGADAKLRVTCTLTGDERIYADAGGEGRAVDPNTESPNGRTVQMDVDASDRFAFREVVSPITSDDYWSRINDGSQEDDERDDQEALQTFADYILDDVSPAQMGGRIILLDVVADYEIGDHVANISGREIDLRRNSQNATTPKYMQITGVTWRPQNREGGTELETVLPEVDPFYRPGARPDGEV
jgi:hypothetical protein